MAYKAAEFAVKYRNKFAKDIVCDLICFRKHGISLFDKLKNLGRLILIDKDFLNP